jgi:hypothetical protein
MSKTFPRTDQIVDCACVIHGTGYEWQYVERLYNMLVKQIPQGIRLHVYTEHHRSVPPYIIKHCLDEWPGIGGPKRSWWYKMQLFNREHFDGPLLYLDLDVVVVRDLGWITDCHTDYFWALRDFRYLQRKNISNINSSVMYFDVSKFSWIWDDFVQKNINDVVKQFPGDQDYLGHVLNVNQRRLFEDRLFESYRWQVLDGGYDFQRRCHRQPGAGARVAGDTAVVVFHGQPKPHQLPPGELRTIWGG